MRRHIRAVQRANSTKVPPLGHFLLGVGRGAAVRIRRRNFLSRPWPAVLSSGKDWERRMGGITRRRLGRSAAASATWAAGKGAAAPAAALRPQRLGFPADFKWGCATAAYQI